MTFKYYLMNPWSIYCMFLWSFVFCTSLVSEVVWAQKTSLNAPLFIEVSLLSRKVRSRLFMCQGIDFASFCDFFIEFWNCSDIVIYLVFFISQQISLNHNVYVINERLYVELNTITNNIASLKLPMYLKEYAGQATPPLTSGITGCSIT